MKVKDLIKTLSKMDQEREVIIPIDSEGNGFHKLEPDCISSDGIVYNKEFSNYTIENISHESWSHQDMCLDSEEEWREYKENCVKCVVIYP